MKPRARESAAEDHFIPSDSLGDQLLAIRRRLWIVCATLESLPARIEQTYCSRSSITGGDRCFSVTNTSDHPCNASPVPEQPKTAAGWWARWKLSRLRSRASRAERQAAAALYDASVSFGEALEAVLQAAVARVKADEAGFQSLPRSFSADVQPGR
jgi:hypothetical protein